MQLYATILQQFRMKLYANMKLYETIQLCNYETCNLCNLSNFMELMQLYATLCNNATYATMQLYETYATMQLYATYATI